MDVWDVEDHPWLIEEKRAIRRWVRELDRPFLGQCLGHELLADAMAGTCGPQRPSEIGIPDVALTPEGTRDPVFAGLPREFKVLQWHSVKVAQPPDDAVVSRVQAFAAASRCASAIAHGACNITSRLSPIRSRNGAKCRPMPRLWAHARRWALDRMAAAAAPYMQSFEENAQTLYRNFMLQMRR